MAMKIERLPAGFGLDIASAALELKESAVSDICCEWATVGWRATGRIKDGKIYTATAQLTAPPDLRLLQCSCSCGEDHCKHVAALLLCSEPPRPRPNATLEPRLRQWLAGFLTDDAPPRGRQYELRFVLRVETVTQAGKPNATRRATLQLVRVPMSGGVAQLDRPEVYALPKKTVPLPSFLQRDQDALQLVEVATQVAHRAGYWDEPLYAVGDQLAGALLLDTLLATGRLCWESVATPLKKGPVLQGRPTWTVNDEGLQVPTLALPDLPGAIVLPLAHPWALDTQTMSLSRVEVDGPPDQTARFLAAPAVSAAQAEALANAMAENNIPLPMPQVGLQQIQLPLRSRLQLSGRKWGNEWLPVAEYQALYASVQARDADKVTVSLGGELVQSPRDFEGEARASEELLAAGFALLTYVGLSERFPELSFPDPLPLQLQALLMLPTEQAWLSFLQNKESFEQETGIELLIQPDFPLQFAEVGEWYGEAQEGQGWFTMNLGVMVDGEPLSLLPLLADLMHTQPQLFAEGGGGIADDELVFARLPDGRRVPLLAGRVRAMVEILVELNLRDKPVSLTLPLTDAARLSHLQEATGVTMTGAEALLSLGEKLRNFTGLTQVCAPHGLQAELRPYQLQGLTWLQFLREYQMGGILADDMGLGKAQPLGARVLTRQGWRRMGDLNVGDEVMGYDGQPTRILGIFPQGQRDIFRVWLDDGTFAEADAEHLWALKNGQLRQTMQLQQGDELPLAMPPTFCGECANFPEQVLQEDFIKQIKQAEVFQSKWLLLSPAKRAEVVRVLAAQGLLTGSCVHDWAVGVQELVQSVGGVLKCEKTQNKTMLTALALPEWVGVQGVPEPVRRIERVEQRGQEEAQCILIEAAHHLYITDHYIVTHNTLQTLAHLLKEKEENRADLPSLIVMPTSVIGNWLNEIKQFVPQMNVVVLHGKNRADEIKNIEKSDLVLTTYPLLTRDIAVLSEKSFHYVILDEAQNIKNSKTSIAKAVGKLNARHRLCLTGTPLENNVSELWSQFNFLSPSLLHDEKTFRELYRFPIEKRGDANRRAALSQRVRPFILRREKKDVARELPPKTEMTVLLDLEGDQRDLYETVRMAMQSRVREDLEVYGLAKSHISILDALLKLRQTVTDPRLVKLEAAAGVQQNAKLTWLQNTLPQMIKEGRKILLFSSFASLIELIEPMLKKQGIRCSKMTGQTTDRAYQIRQFQEGKTDVFLITLKAGGVGLNLTAADTVIHYDPWWNPAAEGQATDRAYRIGQEKPVFVYKLIAAGSVEEKMLDLQARKEALAQGILGGGLSDASQLSAADIERLFAPLE